MRAIDALACYLWEQELDVLLTPWIPRPPGGAGWALYPRFLGWRSGRLDRRYHGASGAWMQRATPSRPLGRSRTSSRRRGGEKGR